MGGRILFVAVFLGMLTGCNRLPGSGDPGIISSLRFSPSAFDSFKRNTELRYSLAAPATVSAMVVRADTSGGEVLVKTLCIELHETKGSHSVTWLGDTDQRAFAPTGTYFGVLEAAGGRYETSVQIFHY